MLKLTTEEYMEAAAKLAEGIARARECGMETESGLAMVALEIFGEDFDVSPVDNGPRDDVESGEVWPDKVLVWDDVTEAWVDNDEALANRAIQSAVEAGPRPFFDFRRYKR